MRSESTWVSCQRQQRTGDGLPYSQRFRVLRLPSAESRVRWNLTPKGEPGLL